MDKPLKMKNNNDVCDNKKTYGHDYRRGVIMSHTISYDQLKDKMFAESKEINSLSFPLFERDTIYLLFGRTEILIKTIYMNYSVNILLKYIAKIEERADHIENDSCYGEDDSCKKNEKCFENLKDLNIDNKLKKDFTKIIKKTVDLNKYLGDVITSMKNEKNSFHTYQLFQYIFNKQYLRFLIRLNDNVIKKLEDKLEDYWLSSDNEVRTLFSTLDEKIKQKYALH